MTAAMDPYGLYAIGELRRIADHLERAGYQPDDWGRTNPSDLVAVALSHHAERAEEIVAEAKATAREIVAETEAYCRSMVEQAQLRAMEVTRLAAERAREREP